MSCKRKPKCKAQNCCNYTFCASCNKSYPRILRTRRRRFLFFKTPCTPRAPSSRWTFAHSKKRFCRFKVYQFFTQLLDLYKAKHPVNSLTKFTVNNILSECADIFHQSVLWLSRPTDVNPKKGETADVYGYNQAALFWVLSVSCWCLAELIFT